MNAVTKIEGGAVTVQPARAVSATPADLLRMAVEQGADLDRLERLMALQERWQAGQAKVAYDEAFAAFKAEVVVILKNRQVTNGPLRGKSYAELFAVVNAVTPALSRHGLSSSWKLTKDDKDWIEVTCFLKHVAGHVETVSMGGPPDSGGAKNAIQARASTVSYLERYTLNVMTLCNAMADWSFIDADPEPFEVPGPHDIMDALSDLDRDSALLDLLEAAAKWRDSRDSVDLAHRALAIYGRLVDACNP